MFIAYMWESVILGASIYWSIFILNVSFYLFWTIIHKQILPIDMNNMVSNERIIGNSRGFEGFILTWFFAVLCSFIQPLSFLLAFGALFGTLFNSFIKRRLHIQRGHYFALDHVDFVLGAALFLLISHEFVLQPFIGAILLALIIHPTVNLGRKTWESFL